MSHNVETMAYAGETPWHGLGVSVPHDLTPEDFLIKAGLDWTVRKEPAYYVYNGHPFYTGNAALIRETDGMVLDTVGLDWEPVQNSEMAGFFHDFVMNNEMDIETGGSLQDGKIVWFLAKTKEAFELCEGKDLIENYLLFSNFHKHGNSTDIRNTDIRVVCNNTFSMAHGKEAGLGVKFDHRQKFDAAEAKLALAKAKKAQQDYKEKAEFLTTKSFDPGQPMDYFGELFPTESEKKKFSRNALLASDMLEQQPGHELGEGSWWQVFNSATFTVDHLIGRNNPDKRLTSAWYGDNRLVKTKALNLAVKYAALV
jgi:phage/plasmid-like protein (TIGR03299 family)